ncbi:MAG TPA: arsinothricin resistance N-acetyltransferase ArsN1 family B [Rhodanobacteraceae bacterium]|nr:arsinothricin resistance N-acetyltransferase ArsN1 family B [Rhodanobacteraceae bacterium]
MPSAAYRIATLDDAAAIAAIYAPYVDASIVSFETEAPDRAEIARRIERIGAQYPWLVATLDERVVGYAYACENRARLAYRWSVDAAVYLDASAHRQGIGRGLYERLFAILREQGYVNAFAGISLPNAGSVGLHEAMGFRLIGVHRNVGYKLGAWRDVGWWQLALADPPADPREPLPFPGFDEHKLARMLAQSPLPRAGEG